MAIIATPATMPPLQKGGSRLSGSSRNGTHVNHAQLIIERGFTYFPFTPPDALIEEVMHGWNEFLSIPKEERDRWKVGDPADYDDGYVWRDPKKVDGGISEQAKPRNGAFDAKSWFHYRPHLTELLKIANVYPSRQQENWLVANNALWKFSVDAFISLGKMLDAELPGFNFAARLNNKVSNAKHVIRLLSYRGKMIPGTVLAGRHPDRNFGTFQIHETHRGLRFNLPSEDVPYVTQPGHVGAFTGSKAAQLTNKRLMAVEHDVVVPQDTDLNENTVRQSIVGFFHIYPDLMPS